LEKFEEYLSSDTRYHVAETESDIIGTVGVINNQHLYHLFVSEQHQRYGVGQELWKVALAAVCKLDPPPDIFVNSSTDAVKFYEKLGFLIQSEPRAWHGVVSTPMNM
jgi:ribosomal protein S18 acetylase RimI-like enzyme